MQRTGWMVVASCLLVGGIARADAPKYVAPLDVTKAKFTPADPSNPKGVQVAVLSGDPMKGPVIVALNLPKGPAPIHWHSSDYSATIVAGKAKHWLKGEDPKKATVNGPGFWWYQPGGSEATAHGDECLVMSCIVVLNLPGKFDMTVVAAPAGAPATPPAKK